MGPLARDTICLADGILSAILTVEDIELDVRFRTVDKVCVIH